MATHTTWLHTLSTCALTAALALSGCNKIQLEEPPPAEKQALKPAEPPAAAPPAPPPAAAPKPEPDAPSEHPAGYPREGWSKVSEKDNLPLCVFSDLTTRAQAKTLKDVKPVKLRADSSITFGAFGPSPCIHESCDQLPTLQCYVDQEGTDLIVHTQYSGYHKDGSTCTENCREVTAGCDTPVLKAGTYTVKHGAKSYKLKLPSTPKSPCFD
jgi:hypothetical protein